MPQRSIIEWNGSETSMNPLSPLSPSRRTEAARAALRELVRAARDVEPYLDSGDEFLRRRFQSVLSRVESLTGKEVDAEAFDAVFRDPVPDRVGPASSSEERRLARLDASSLDSGALARIVDDAEASDAHAARADALESRLNEAQDRALGIHDALDIFERLRVSERRPVVGKDDALDVGLIRRVVASLDANGMKKAADTLIWSVWHRDRAARQAAGVLPATALRALRAIGRATTLEEARRLAEAALASAQVPAEAAE